MASESFSSTDLTMATAGDDPEVAVTSKGESVAEAAHENGYESECSSVSRSDEEVAYSALETEADAFTRFIERQRVEVMFELRRLRLGERPVTGQPNRERIETFINNARENHQETRAPSTRPVVPSAHMADIDALSSRRCVSAALGTLGFRQDLENVVRQSIGIRTAAPTTPTPQRPPAPPASAAPSVVPAPPPTVAVQQTSHVERQERQINAWEAITQLQRERIVVEISDLVHRQLVTSALESDYRQHLERSVLGRLERGAPPQHNYAPNPTVAAPTLPNPVTVTSPHHHASASTIDALATRLDTMQQMLQQMFLVQMDMQRSLRQEVAGALASTSTTNHARQPVDAGQCTVCLTATADTVLYRCGHLCVCYTCGLHLRQATSVHGVKCPICRAPVDDILRVYRSSRDGE